MVSVENLAKLQSLDQHRIASFWLKTCSEEHYVCNLRKGTMKRFIPTRLIEVGSDELVEEPKLILTGQSKIWDRRYLTLSHCWGEKVPITTSTLTLPARLVEIPFNTLPSTFQDAVIITRRLGVKCLWIDSLCIIQDSLSDWEKESAVMGKVYSHSYCNIAALSSKDSHGGCLSSSISKSLGSAQESSTTDSPQPLSQRGWFLQERHLSRRTLKYTKDPPGVAWECRSLRASSGPSVDPLEHIDDLKNRNIFSSQTYIPSRGLLES